MRRARRTLAAFVAAAFVAMAAVPAGASATGCWFFCQPAPAPNPPGSVPFTGGWGGNPYIPVTPQPAPPPPCSAIHHLFGLC